MPASCDYAEQLCARLPRVLQELREGKRLSKYALGKKCGVSREMIACIECGDSIPTFYVGARLAHGMGMSLAMLIGRLEDAREMRVGCDASAGG